MAYKKGSAMILYCDTNGSGNYVQVAAIQNVRVSNRGDAVEVTNQQSSAPGAGSNQPTGGAMRHAELLEGAGIFKQTISGSGVWSDASPMSTIEQYSVYGTHRNWRCVVPGGQTYTGLYQVIQLERQAPHAKEATFDISLESAGLITIS